VFLVYIGRLYFRTLHFREDMSITKR
jgi:hypothetical protein